MFKVGDWVVFNNEVDEPITFQISYIGKWIHNKKDDRFTPALCDYWQPKVGEWCWCYSSQGGKGTDIPPNLVRYSHYYEDLIVEPFIGELPSFIKEK